MLYSLFFSTSTSSSSSASVLRIGTIVWYNTPCGVFSCLTFTFPWSLLSSFDTEEGFSPVSRSELEVKDYRRIRGIRFGTRDNTGVDVLISFWLNQLIGMEIIHSRRRKITKESCFWHCPAKSVRKWEASCVHLPKIDCPSVKRYFVWGMRFLNLFSVPLLETLERFCTAWFMWRFIFPPCFCFQGACGLCTVWNPLFSLFLVELSFINPRLSQSVMCSGLFSLLGLVKLLTAVMWLWVSCVVTWL